MKNIVLLFGPRIGFSKASYGGGTGGYTRNMSTYLNSFTSNEFQLIPCFHSVRTANKSFKNNFIFRLFFDTYTFLLSIMKFKPKIVHVLAQYRTAIPREFMVCFFSKVFSVSHIYEIKAGQFDVWYQNTNFLNKYLVRFIINNSSEILVEGHRYIGFLRSEFDREAIYWPNFVPSNEIPHESILKPRSDVVKICFIGYCYFGKGIFELVNGLDNLDLNKRKVELHIVGHESEEFSSFLKDKKLNYKIIRYGKLEHKDVLKVLECSDLFCLPTKHSGEGHNNSVNEAMMLKIPIMCTKHGFLYDILKDNRAYFIEDLNKITSSFEKYLDLDREIDEMTSNAYDFFKGMLHSDVVIPKLELIYKSRIN